MRRAVRSNLAAFGAIAGVTAFPAGATLPGANGVIVFSRGTAATRELAVINEDGSSFRALGVTGQAPSWSPDGTRIVFMREVSDQPGDFRLFVVNADGSDAHRLTRSDIRETQPAWSPDGSLIAFTGGRTRAVSDVYLVSADGSTFRRLTSSRGFEVLPTWSPDGRWIAYAGQRHCSVRFLATCDLQVFVMKADGSGKRRVTRTRMAAVASSWSPDEMTLALGVFAKADDLGLRATAIATVHTDGTAFRVITPFGDNYAPAWAPDGSRIVFESGGRRQSGAELRSVAPDGSAEHGVVAGGGEPDWQRIAG